MRKLIFAIPVSLDGFIEGPNRELDWVIADDDLHDFSTQLLLNSDLILYGRVTYELMASYWPTATQDASVPAGMARFANAVNPMEKIVFSKTLRNPGWNTRVLTSIIPEEILALKAQPGGTILLGGGATLVNTFRKYGLIDEYQLIVQPVVLGAGKPLFSDISARQQMEFMWSRSLSAGVIVLGYRYIGNLLTSAGG